MKRIFTAILFLISATTVMAQCPYDYSVQNNSMTICPPSSWGTVYVNVSEPGVSYQLRLNGTNVGDPQMGNWGGITWNNLDDPGVYTVVATHYSGCSRTLSGSVTISVTSAQTLFNVTGTNLCVSSGTATITLSGSEVSINYQLIRDGIYIEGTSQGTGSALSWDNIYNAGAYTVRANSGCSKTMNGVVGVGNQYYYNYYSVSGGGYLCNQNDNYPVYLNGSQPGVSYQLVKEGTNVGSPKMGTGSLLTWDNIRSSGSYSVRATWGSCTSQNMYGSATITNNQPSIYSVTGGGCAGYPTTTGTITLSGSQVGFTYRVIVNGYDAAQQLTGTGSALTWTNLNSAGTYSVIGYNNSCSAYMNGVVTLTYTPSIFSVSGGGFTCAPAQTASVQLNGWEPGITYQLKRDGVDVGSPISGPENMYSPLVWSNLSEGGTYTVVASGASGCSVTMSGNAVITDNHPVLYTLSGGGILCGSGTVNIQLSNSQPDMRYHLKKNGNEFGNSTWGTGSALNWPITTSGYYDYQLEGIYTVVAENSSQGCMQPMTGSATVTYYQNLNQFSVSGGGTFCSGGTGVPITLNSSETGVNYQLKLNGTNTGQPIAGTGNQLTWNNQIAAGTYTIVAANPATGCSTQMAGNAVVVINSLPGLFTITGGGYSCSGSSLPINLSGSESSVNYQLMRDGINYTNASGTGSAITLTTTSTSGAYTVIATNNSTGCIKTLTGSVSVTASVNPSTFSVSGGGSYCSGGTGVNVNLNGSQIGFNYQLKINGTNAGAPVAGTSGVLTWSNQTTAGTYTVFATNATSGCNGTMSGSAIVSINPLPTQFTVGGGGSFCTSGVSITLSGSQTGVNYQLKVNGANIGSLVSGTGSTLSWASQTTSGTYTVVATNATTGCTQTMTGSATATGNPLPGQFTMGGGGGYCSGATGLSVTLSGSQNGIHYQLKINGTNSGAPTVGTGSALTWTNQTTSGAYTVLATNTTTGCIQTMLGNVGVTINSLPNLFTVGGGGSYCSGGTGMNVTLSGSQTGINYQLKLNNSNTGTPLSGTGSPLTWINQTGAGTYTIVATNATTSCTQLMTGSAAITINALPTQYAVGGGGTYCFGGIGVNVTLSNSQAGVSYQLKLNGANTATPITGTGNALTWPNQTASGTYTLSATNASSCTQPMTGSATITVTTPPGVITGAAQVNVEPITLSVNAAAGYAYQWKRDGDNVTTNGQASSLLVFESGNYQVQATGNGCTRLSDPFYVSKNVKKQYNGIIAATRWRTGKVYGNTDDGFKGMYAFDYDEKYQIKGAQWANPDLTTNTFSVGGNMFKLSNMSYDANGNIETLKRFDKTGAKTNDFTYKYDPNKNKLRDVTGYSNNNNRSNHGYKYNAIGQMINQDLLTGNDQYVEYDVTGKVLKVFSDSLRAQLKVEFIYDDRGFRLAKKNSASHITTWYIRDASGNILSIYEEDTNTNSVSQTEVPVYGAGKLGTIYPQQANSTAYELTDHLGNVRAIVKEHVQEFLATIEDNGTVGYTNPRVIEMAVFKNLFATEKKDARLNHTPGGEYSAYLNWIDGIQAESKAIGPATALKVSTGDTLKLEAWARFEKKVNYTRNLTLLTLTQFLGNTFAGIGNFEGKSPAQTATAFNTGLGGAGYGSNEPEVSRPYAYLNYIIFDQNTGFVNAGWRRVPATAGFDPGQESLPNMHKKVAFDQPIIIPKNGYIYVWVSNESENTKVWFDDIKITQVKAYVDQATDYGVWGDVIREQKTDPSSIYRFAYQGQFAEKDDETGWNAFELRMYDPIIGRWLIPDPYRQHWSPYVAMGNSPVNKVDPDGGTDECPECTGMMSKEVTVRATRMAPEQYFEEIRHIPSPMDATRYVLNNFGKGKVNPEMQKFQEWLNKKGGINFYAKEGQGDFFMREGRADQGYDVNVLWDAEIIDSGNTYADNLSDWAKIFDKQFGGYLRDNNIKVPTDSTITINQKVIHYTNMYTGYHVPKLPRKHITFNKETGDTIKIERDTLRLDGPF